MKTILFALLMTTCLPGQKVVPKNKEKLAEKNAKLEWIDWKPGLPEAYRKKGKIVWLRFHADWCLTCKMNEQRAFDDQKVVRKLKELGVVLISADLTRQNEALHKELKKYGRHSVPTNMVIPVDPSLKPLLAPEVMFPDDALKLIEKGSKLREEGA